MGDSAVLPIRSVRTVCPFCSSGCGLYLTGTSHDIEGVGPSEHHPVSQGRLCARGWAAHEASQWGPRLRAPLVRQGGELRPASWEEALAAVVAGLRRLRAAGRPVGVLASGRASSEESFLALALARSALQTPHLDAPLRLQWEALLRGVGAVGAQPEPGAILTRLERSDLVVVLEDDLSVSHPRVALSILRALRRGARLVTVAWQHTPLAALATQHVPLDASAPLATLAGLRALDGLEGLFRGARRASFVVAPFEFDPELLEAAGAATARLAADLGVADRGEPPLLLPLATRANTRGSLEMGIAPDRLPGRRSLADAHVRATLAGLWGADGCWDEGASADEMPGAVAGLIVLGEDLPAVHPQPAEARRQLSALEHLVVVDSFLTETARAAAVVLPMAAFGEADGIQTGIEDRAQLVRALSAPPAGVRAGWEVLAELLAALGCGFRPRTLADVREAIATTVPGYGLLRQSAPDDGWTVAWRGELGSALGNGNGGSHPAPAEPALTTPAEQPPASARRFVLRRAGAFDWGQDALVRYSPTLRRIPAAQARRYPHGLVVMNAADAKTLGVREGWTVRLTSPRGEARAAVTLSAGVQQGLLLAPYGFREQLGPVLGASGLAEVEVQPA